MKDFEILVTAGRGLKTGHGFRGALIQLEGDIAYLTNIRRSILFKIQSPSVIGTGTFYASEAPINSDRVERRDGRVLFEFAAGGVKKSILIPDKPSISDLGETILSKYYHEPTLDAPLAFMNELDPSFPITKLIIEDNALTIAQKRGDGSVEIRSRLSLSTGFGAFNTQDPVEPAEVNIFTRDLTDLKTAITGKVRLYVHNGLPLSIKTALGSSNIIGVIGNLTYEEV